MLVLGQQDQKWTLRLKLRIWNYLPPDGYLTNVTLENNEILSAYSRKASLIQPKHTCAYPYKQVEVIPQPTITPPELHTTKQKNNSEPWEEVKLIKDTIIHICTNNNKWKRFGTH